MIEHGKNPKHRLSHSKLFKDIALDWLQTQDYLSDGTIKATTQRLSRCLDEFGHVPISEIDSIQVLTFLQKIENRGYIETAKRTRSIISRGCEYANILNLTNGENNQSPEEAKKQTIQFIKDRLNDAEKLASDGNRESALIQLGYAMHLVMDKSSPAHTDKDGRAIPWDGILGAGATNHSSGKWYLPDGIERKRDLTPAILDSQKELLPKMYDEVFK